MTEENEVRVAMTFVNSPKKSTRRAAQELSLPRTSLLCLMRKLNLKPYRPRLLHGLLEDENKVYERKPQTVDEMKEFITDAFMGIDSDRKLCRTVSKVSDRLDACCNVDGGHFEHLRD